MYVHMHTGSTSLQATKAKEGLGERSTTQNRGYIHTQDNLLLITPDFRYEVLPFSFVNIHILCMSSSTKLDHVAVRCRHLVKPRFVNFFGL